MRTDSPLKVVAEQKPQMNLGSQDHVTDEEATDSPLKVVAEQKPQMNLGSQELATDEEAGALTASKRRDQVMRVPARCISQRTLASIGLAAASALLLLAVVGLNASSWADLWPGLCNRSQVTASKLGTTSLFSGAEEQTKEKAMTSPLKHVQLLKAVFDKTSANTFFEEIQMDDGTVSYRHGNGLLITAIKGERVVSSPVVPGSVQFFVKKINKFGELSLMVHGGTWLTALPSGIIVADATYIQSWQTFTEEKADDGTVALRSVHGKYLGLQSMDEKSPFLQAHAEEFIVAADTNMLTTDDGVGNQTIAAEPISVITTAQADSIGSTEKFTVVHNKVDETVNFKTKFGTFLTSPPKLDGLVSGDSSVACGREAFNLIKKDGRVYLHTFDGRYITALEHGFLVGDAIQPRQWESFDMVTNGDGTVSFKSWHGKYITAVRVPLLPSGGDWAFKV